MKRYLKVLAAVAATVVVFSASAQATVLIDFGAIPFGGTPSYTGTSLDQSTAFDFGGGSYVVNQIGSGDQSGLNLMDTISLTNPTYGSGDSGTLIVNMIKSWTVGMDTYTETLTSFTANRGTPNAITLTLTGTLTGPGGINQTAYALLNANQVGGPGPGNAINWSFTNTSFPPTDPPTVPEPATLAIFGLGLAGFGFMKRRKAA